MFVDSNNNFPESQVFSSNAGDTTTINSDKLFKPLSPQDESQFIESDLNCDVIESDCMSAMATDGENDDAIAVDEKIEKPEEQRRLNGFNRHVTDNAPTSIQRRSGSFRSTTGNFIKAFITARVKAKSCSPTPSSVALVNGETAPPGS